MLLLKWVSRCLGLGVLLIAFGLMGQGRHQNRQWWLIAYTDAGAVYLTDETGQFHRQMAASTANSLYYDPQWSSDGRWLLVARHEYPQAGGTIVTTTLPMSAKQQNRLHLSGAIIFNGYTWVGAAQGVAVSDAFGLHYAPLDGSRRAKRIAAIQPTGLASSPNGEWFVGQQRVEEGFDLFKFSVAEQSYKVLEHKLHHYWEDSFVLSEDGQWLYFADPIDDEVMLIRLRTDGTGVREVLLPLLGRRFLLDDAHQRVFSLQTNDFGRIAGSGNTLFVRPLQAEGEWQRLFTSPAVLHSYTILELSRDGNLLLFSGVARGDHENLYVLDIQRRAATQIRTFADVGVPYASISPPVGLSWAWGVTIVVGLLMLGGGSISYTMWKRWLSIR